MYLKSSWELIGFQFDHCKDSGVHPACEHHMKVPCHAMQQTRRGAEACLDSKCWSIITNWNQPDKAFIFHIYFKCFNANFATLSLSLSPSLFVDLRNIKGAIKIELIFLKKKKQSELQIMTCLRDSYELDMSQIISNEHLLRKSTEQHENLTKRQREGKVTS